ncbi:MAG TPA: glutathione-disulfide reductase, partial [Candidatus Binataceae bacterium]|nr:glutathione-disulfide reductase [Candidatus Binataceae bacterium]
YDLFTIGGGSGGVRASRMAAQFGARVALAEERYLGGTCVNVGCIPKKLFVYASEFSEDFKDSAGFGWTVGARNFNWQTLIANKDREIARLNGVYEKVLVDNGVRILRARATIADAHTVVVGGERLTARYILVATGGWPSTPSIPGGELAVTSNEAFFLPQFPARVLLVGGGYIGVEFAGIFHGLGAKVTLVHRGDLFLRGFDDDLRRMLATAMGKGKIELRFNSQVERIEKLPRGIRATLSDGAALEADLIMFATGRTPNTHDLGLERAGVKLDYEGAVVVDSYSCSSAANIYAVGDCTDRMQLTPVAIAEGQAVAETLFHGNPQTPDYENVPTAVFCQPHIGTVGLTEAEARARYRAVDVYKSSFRPLKHTVGNREENSFMKLVVDRETDRVLGCHMLGDDAGEIIQGLAIALKCRATKAQFDATIGIHPTAAEEFVTMRTKSPE